MPGKRLYACQAMNASLSLPYSARMNGLGDETSTGAQRAASDEKKAGGGKGFSITFHAYRTQLRDLTR